MTSADGILGVGPHVAPAVTQESAPFWSGGQAGELRICRCNACGLFLHPPSPVCRSCRSMDVEPQAVSGRGVLNAYSVNYHKWFADHDGPYVAAIVDLDDCPGVRLVTNIVGCRLSDLKRGMPVEVQFHEFEGAWLPLFRPSSP